MSKKKRGLSLDDKRNAILGIYHEHKEPFNLKEIETYGSKKGVVLQTIKDVNQSLVDDSLILSDKIGAANFFWSFPSKTYLDQVTQKNNYEVSIGALKRNIETDTESIENLKKVRCMANRNELLQELNNLKSEEKKIDEVIEQYKYNDPEEIQKIEKEIEYIREHANRWTDNVWSIKSFLVKKKGMNSKEAEKILKIDSNFDYL